MQPAFLDATGAEVDAYFGAVGTLRDALLAGEACDVMIVTAQMASALQSDGWLVKGTEAALGRVRTGIAVRAGDALPAIDTREALKASLLAASAIYFPDAQRSTAGIHFASVLGQLGIADLVQARLRTFPNGATAMRALADDGLQGAIGCTQVTEIRYTPGIALVGALPKAFELATVYSAAIGASASQPEVARQFIDFVTGPRCLDLREQGGFE